MYNENLKKNKKKKEEEHSFLTTIFRKRTRRLLTLAGRLYEKIMWTEVCISLAMIIIGVICLMNPEISVKAISILFGLGVLTFGAFNLYCFSKTRDIPLFRFYLVYGIIAILLGIITILNPFLFSQVVTIFIGLWIIYIAIIKIDLGLRLKIISERSWLLLILTAALEIFMSVLIIINPFSNLALTQVAGTYLVLCGVLNISNLIMAKNRAYDFLENL